MSFNHNLASSISEKDLFDLGFVVNEDGTKDPRGTTYDLENNNFWITLDAWFEVKLHRKNPDTDEINLVIDSKHDLECLVDWIKDEVESKVHIVGNKILTASDLNKMNHEERRTRKNENIPDGINQRLFDTIYDLTGCVLLQSEMKEIIDAVKKDAIEILPI